MSMTPELRSAMNSEYRGSFTASSDAGTNEKSRETTRRILCGIGMIAPVSAYIALVAWYVAI